MVPERERRVRALWSVADGVIAVLATLAAAWMRYDMNIKLATSWDIWKYAITLGLCVSIVSYAAMMISRSHRRGTFEETAQLLRSGLVAATIAALLVFSPGPPDYSIPRSLPFLAPVTAILGAFALRFVIRSWRWGGRRACARDRLTIVYGAGEGGRQLVQALVRDQISPNRLVPVAILDDDSLKRHWRIEGVPVRGGLIRLAEVAEATGASVLAVAIPSITQEQLRSIRAVAREHDLELLVLPTAAQLLGAPTGADLRHLNLEDLLGRRAVELDANAIAATISGKRVLVTGAGGSIGAELCRQIVRFGPAKLVLLDRDESALHATQLSMTGRALLDDGTLALADIRDPAAMRAIFETERPEVVFHAAALKHLTLLEQFPLEAWKTNVLGTLNVLQAAEGAGVTTFVNISTDKAADPQCVLGYSKRVAERLTAGIARYAAGTWVSVRFGNVLGSRGSVLTAFTAQIDRGGPVTVTHPEVERYFMLIPEACQLVLQAAAIGQDGQAMVLDMGTPVKIADVAKTLIELSGKPGVEVVYTGLRPGEKLSEVLFSSGVDIQRSAHPLVSQVDVPAIDHEVVTDSGFASPVQAADWMQQHSITRTFGTDVQSRRSHTYQQPVLDPVR